MPCSKHEALLCELIPLLCSIAGTIELVSFTEVKQSWDLKEEEKFAALESMKAAGNEYFAKADYARAIRRYV